MVLMFFERDFAVLYRFRRRFALASFWRSLSSSRLFCFFLEVAFTVSALLSARESIAERLSCVRLRFRARLRVAGFFLLHRVFV
jgi:hypothetical protein